MRLCTLPVGDNVHSIQMMNPGLFLKIIPVGQTFQGLYMIGSPPPQALSLSLVWACSHRTDWPVICESPMVSLIIHDRCCHTSPSISAWDLNGKSSISMDDRLDLCGSGPKEELGDNSFAQSVNPGTENTSVAQGSLFHQRSVWQHLRQMLCC